MSDRVRHCDFYRYCASRADDPDAYAWVHSCCGGPWEERPYGHYAGCTYATDWDECADAASEIYTKEGVRIWMAAKNRMLQGCSPEDLIRADEKQRVLDLVDYLAEGNFA